MDNQLNLKQSEWMMIVLERIAIASACCATIICLAYIREPYPLELREFGFVMPSIDIQAGENPFKLDAAPNKSYLYGALYPLLMSLPSAAFGPSLATHRYMSLLLLVCAVLVLYRFLLARCCDKRLARIGASFLALILMSGAYSVSARPDSLGILLFLTTFMAYEYSKGGRHGWWLWLSVIAGILACHTKSYFGLGILLVSLHALLARNWHSIKVLFVGGLLVALASLWLAEFIFPGYVAMLTSGANMELSWSHMIDNGLFFAAQAAGFALMGARSIWLQRNEILNGRCIEGLAALGGGLVLVALLGRHQGNSLLYWNQLLLPFIIALALNPLFWPKKKLVPFGLLLATCLACSFRLPPWPSPDDGPWNRLVRAVNKANPPVLGSPISAPVLHNANMEVIDTGVTEYHQGIFRNGDYCLDPEKKRIGADFVANISNLVVGKRFGLIITGPDGMHFLVPKETIKTSYQRVSVVEIPTWRRRIQTVELWEPR